MLVLSSLPSCKKGNLSIMIKKQQVISCFSLFLLFTSPSLIAHGSMEIPLSRVYNCYQEGPENLKSDACKAMINYGDGKQALYDWDMVNQGAANDNHKAVIPDGTLCAGGRDKYAGLNLPRVDWYTTTITPDSTGKFNFVWRATVPHASKYFKFYLTKDSYDFTTPLKWSDLEDQPFCTINSVTLSNGRYTMSCPLPAKTGRRILYVIWQRSDSPEAFYSCSNIILGNTPAPISWKLIDNFNATSDVPVNTKINFWLMKNCEAIGSWTYQAVANQNLATQWPYYLASIINKNSTIVNIGVLNTTTGTITPTLSSTANKIYIRNTDTNQYDWIVDFIQPSGTPTLVQKIGLKKYCVEHQLKK